MFKKIFIILFSFGAFNSSSALDAAKEYEIKAVYLFNLGSFMRWPPNALPDGQPFGICILGKDPFGADLDFVVANKKLIQDHQVVVKRLFSIAQVDHCHILFISNSEQLRLSTIFKALRKKPILSVGESDRFVIQGGMIQFYRRGSKIRLILDPETIEESGLKASAHLMRIARF